MRKNSVTIAVDRKEFTEDNGFGENNLFFVLPSLNIYLAFYKSHWEYTISLLTTYNPQKIHTNLTMIYGNNGKDGQYFTCSKWSMLSVRKCIFIKEKTVILHFKSY